MQRDIRLATATREELLQVIRQQRATIAQQQQTIQRLEALVEHQRRQIAGLTAANADLEQRLAGLEQRLPPTGGWGWIPSSWSLMTKATWFTSPVLPGRPLP